MVTRWRDYEPDTDEEAVARIWREVGWIDGDSDSDREAFALFGKGYRGIVADLNGAPECYVATGAGSMRYQDREVPLSVVAAVTTSHVARRQGLAGELTAESVARDALDGAMVSALGIFDQGYYDRLGFGTGGYEVWRSFDPGHLRVPVEPAPADPADRGRLGAGARRPSRQDAGPRRGQHRCSGCVAHGDGLGVQRLWARLCGRAGR